jgi:uncharacterized protein
MQTNRLIAFSLVAVGVGVAITSIHHQIRKQNHVEVITLATGGVKGEYYAFGTAVGKVSSAHYSKLKLDVIESTGSNQNMEDIQAHKVDLAFVQNNTLVQPNARAVAQLYPEMFHFVASKASGIKTIGDIKNKRIALMPTGSGSYDLFWPLIAHYGLQPGDFQVFPMSSDKAQQALLEGKVDALFMIIGIGNSSMADLLQTERFQLLPIEQIGAMKLKQPYLQETFIPKGTYKGNTPIPPDDLPVAAVSALLIANKDTDPQAVKDITRILYENRSELIAINPRTANIQSPESSRNLGLPLHPGAQAYYNQDEPSFWVQYSDQLGLLLSVGVLISSGLWQMRSWFISNQKNRADSYNLEIMALIEQVEQTETIEELQSVRKGLFNILKQVISDLDIDRISPESFQSFAFPWEVAMSTIRHHELILRKQQDPKKIATKHAPKQD